MVDNGAESERFGYRRRDMLAATGTVLASGSLAALAGCISEDGSGSDGSDNSTNNGQTNETTDDDSTSSSESSQAAFEKDTGSHPLWVANPAQNGCTAEFSGPGSDGEVLWKYPEGDGMSVSTAGTLFTVDGVSYKVLRHTLEAIGPDGDKLWSKNLGLEETPVPVMIDGTLVLASPTRALGYNPEDGSRKWMRQLDVKYSYVKPVGKYNNQILFLANGPDNNWSRVLWFDPLEPAVTKKSDKMDRRIGRDSRLPILGGEHLYLHGGTAVSLSDGTVSWNNAPPTGSIDSGKDGETHLYTNGTFIQSVQQGYDKITSIRALDAATGEVQWKLSNIKKSDGYYQMAADDERVYVSAKKKVSAYKLSDGSKSWEQITASRITTNLAIGGSNLYFVTKDKKLHVLDTASGERKTRYGVPYRYGSLTVVGNRLYCNKNRNANGMDSEHGQTIVIE